MDICSICLEDPIFKIKLECNHIFCYLCLKTFLEKGNLSCPNCRSSIEECILEEAQACIDYIDEYYQEKGNWTYSGRNNGHWYYDKLTAGEIEEKYQNWKNGGEPTFMIRILNRDYTINFEDMTQSSFGRKRTINRICDDDMSLLIKGFAGLRSPSETKNEVPESSSDEKNMNFGSDESEDEDYLPSSSSHDEYEYFSDISSDNDEILY